MGRFVGVLASEVKGLGPGLPGSGARLVIVKVAALAKRPEFHRKAPHVLYAAWMPTRVLVCVGLKVALFVALFTALLASLHACPVMAEPRSAHDLQATLRSDGDIEVVETITLSGDWSKTKATRSFWLLPADDAWPLRQSVQDVGVFDEAGAALAFRERAYEDRSNIDLLELPESGTLVLHYRIHRPLTLKASRAEWQWMVTGYSWKAEVSSVRLRLSAPHSLATASLTYASGYSDAPATSAEFSEDALGITWDFKPGAAADEPIRIALGLPKGEIGAAPSNVYWRDVMKLCRIPLAALVLLFVLGFILIVAYPWRAIVITGFANVVPGLVALISAFWVTRYWYFEQGHRGVGDDFSGEFIINFGLAGFVVLFAWKQRRVLAKGKRAAYFAQLAFPAVLVVAWPIAFVDRAMLIFPLLALPTYVYWTRRKIALEFGVGAYRISEEVGGRGEISVAELAEHMRLSEPSLLKALRQNPHLPVVVDTAHQMVLSAEAAAMHDELRVCTYCGGATEVAGMAVRKCGYCEREFTSSKKRRTEKPLPVVIESLAIFFEMLTSGAFFLAGTIALAIFVMEAVGGSLIDGLVGAVIAGAICCIPAVLLSAMGSGLRKGQHVGVAKIVLVLFSWLLLPLFVLRALSSKRVGIFTGAVDTKELAKRIDEQGELTLPEFAHYLQSNVEDAAELAQYLAVNQIIDIVYDRRDSRLVSRKLYREIAKEGSCTRCGGFFGVQQGRATCHFCGEAPRTA
tara:strand:+ start:53748 stop:55979 length:2232 start_codon:yes stop_codon:yes gene_type:complete